MKYVHSLVLFMVTLSNCLAVPIDLKDTNAELINQSKLQHQPDARNVIIDTAKRWPNNIVCYRFNLAFNTDQRNCVRDAMDYIESLTHVRFVQGSIFRWDCVSINPVPAGSGCASNIGYQGAPQTLTLPNIPVGTGCFTKFIVVHELLHTCGMYHQHMAHDRDDYVVINWDNIIAGRESAFAKQPASETTSFGYTYDYDSIMHYGPKISSSNGLDTIVPKINVTIGQRTHMSSTDVLKMLAMYPEITTQNATENITDKSKDRY